jgi:hypothetical protein
MSTELQVFDIGSMERMALSVAKSGLMAGINTPEAAFTLMMICQSEGIHAMQAVKRYHIIEGRASMKAEAMLAEFLSRDGEVEWIQSDDTAAEAIFSHPKRAPKGYRKVITFADMKAKGITEGKYGTKDNWKKFADAMLRARLISSTVRMLMPEIVVGIYTPEEVMDFTEPTKEPVKQSKQLFTSQPRQVPEAILAEVVDTATGEILAAKPERVNQAAAINGAGEAKAEPATVPQVGEWDFLGADKLLVELYSKSKGYIMPMDTLDDLADAMKFKLKSQGPKVIAQAKAWEAAQNGASNV